MDQLIVNPSYRRKEGVLLLWEKEVKISQLFSHTNYNDAPVEDTKGIWCFTSF